MTSPPSEKTKTMKEPTTPEEVRALHQIMRTDPQRYLQLTSAWINANPNSPHAYFERHFGWLKIGEPQRALEDMNRVIELKPDQFDFFSRGCVYRQLGEYEKAIEDFERGERMCPEAWRDYKLPLLYRADCHARLGDRETALEYCERLPDDFWTPGMDGTPSGNKAEVAAKLRQISAEARARNL
jgi:tetratricopeptide (TPR) repeat protein